MRQPCILLIESLNLPQYRKRAFHLLTHLTDPVKGDYAIELLQRQILDVHKQRGLPVSTLRATMTDEDYQELVHYLVKFHKKLLQRLVPIMVRAGEIKGGQLV